MQVSVVVPTFNRREIVLRTIQSLFEQNYPSSEFEIVVVVDGSTDGTQEALGLLRSPCRFQVITQDNRGLAAARNTGWQAAQNDLVIFLDDDMRSNPTLVRAHRDAHSMCEASLIGVGAVFLSEDSPPTLAAECFNREIGSFFLRRDTSDAEIPRIFGNTSIQRDVLMKAGGFDERFHMREDAELFARLRLLGVRTEYVPGAVAHQYYNKTNSDLLHDAEAFAVADLLLVREHPDALTHTLLGKLEGESGRKRIFHRAMARLHAITDPLLSLICWVGSSFSSQRAIRNLGVRALQQRRLLAYYRKATENVSAS